MEKNLFVKDSITIDASASSVWDALVNPEQTKKYMFGCETVSDWKIGSPLHWRGNYEGQDMVFVKGNIVDLQPEKLLSYTTIDPNNAEVPDVPENYLTVTYKLTEENGQTTLEISQGDYSTVADGERRYEDTVEGGGWSSILEAIKLLLEEGKVREDDF
ncbi:MAG TPA: SRPBCC domain-containing protein [Saprospiraceae bacterium]|nr:SRPBCC domain-containing protein [Saprospiraceae bacterium]